MNFMMKPIPNLIILLLLALAACNAPARRIVPTSTALPATNTGAALPTATSLPTATVAPTTQVTPTPSPTLSTFPTPTLTPTLIQPIVRATVEPIPIEPLIVAPQILFAGWSPMGDWFAFHTFTAEQDEKLDLIVEGPISYPPASLHFYHVPFGQSCQYPRPVEVGNGSPTWLPDGKVLLQVSGTWFQGTPCSDDFSIVGDPEFLQTHLPDPGLSPKGTYRAERVYECRDGFVDNTLSITRVATGEQVNHIDWLDEALIGSCWDQSPGGQWVEDDIFLIPQTLEQGPLLVEAGQRITQIAPDLFGEPISPCSEESCRLYHAFSIRAEGSQDPHFLLAAGDRYEQEREYRLYHPENGEIEKLPYPAIWWPGHSPDGDWLLMDDQPGEHNTLWIRRIDPPEGAFRLFITGVRFLTWSASGQKVATTGRDSRISTFSFPEGSASGSWHMHDYDPGPIWSPDEENIVLIGSTEGEYGLSVVAVKPEGQQCQNVIALKPSSAEAQAVLSAVLAHQLETNVGELLPETPFKIAEVQTIMRQGDWVLVQASFSAYLEPGIFLLKRTSQGFDYDRMVWGGQADSAADLRLQLIEENADVPQELLDCFEIAGWFVP